MGSGDDNREHSRTAPLDGRAGRNVVGAVHAGTSTLKQRRSVEFKLAVVMTCRLKSCCSGDHAVACGEM